MAGFLVRKDLGFAVWSERAYLRGGSSVALKKELITCMFVVGIIGKLKTVN